MRSIKDIFRDAAVFDNSGKHVNGSDKQSNHSYGDAYEQLFFAHEEREVKITEQRIEVLQHRVSLRNQVKLMMEVGVADGSCLLAWREIFPNALVVGMDIHNCEKAKNQDRIEFHLGDQRSKLDCERAAMGRQFDMVVDDATHELDATLLTLYWLWPFVRPGGLYVVEEWPNVSRPRITALWPQAEIVDTQGPFGGNEPLIVFRKSSRFSDEG